MSPRPPREQFDGPGAGLPQATAAACAGTRDAASCAAVTRRRAGLQEPAATQRRGMFIADGRLASAALALADADVAGPHDVRAVAELLRDAAVLHWAVRVLLLPVERHLLHERDLLGVNFRRAHLAPLLVLRLLLIVVLRVDDADDMHLVGQA
eukprot:CAMPEP_0170260598 /NCGR_PEP_ID=MMETSP0116_2-20130129/30176_1 /TAXON_ID=400756 /ORGANISM="Durinskia baltica, Strain CSIRO CS-38" /LENGTH=152 /DNA_ID=CAMNT_0010511655 /DNA_START=186 /DNA_END=641 /DNA_ORIENTATION=+